MGILFWCGILGLVIYIIYRNSDAGKEATREKKKQKEEEQKKKAEELLKSLNDLGIYPTKILSGNSGFSIVYVDNNNKKILFSTLRGKYVVNYSDIIDFELKVDSLSTYRYSLATELTGRLTTRNVVESIVVNVYVNNIDNPIIEVRSLGNGQQYSVNSDIAYTGRKFAEDLIGVLKYIKHNQETKN